MLLLDAFVCLHQLEGSIFDDICLMRLLDAFADANEVVSSNVTDIMYANPIVIPISIATLMKKKKNRAFNCTHIY